MSPPTVLRPALKSGVLEAAGWVSWGAGVAAGFRVTEIAGLDVWLSELLTLMDGVEIFLNVTLMAGVGLGLGLVSLVEVAGVVAFFRPARKSTPGEDDSGGGLVDVGERLVVRRVIRF